MVEYGITSTDEVTPTDYSELAVDAEAMGVEERSLAEAWHGVSVTAIC